MSELLLDADEKIIEFKKMQQELTNEMEVSKSEQKVIMLSIDHEYESLQKMIDQKKAQLIHALNAAYDTYIERVGTLSDRLESEMTNLEASLANKPSITGDMSLKEIGNAMEGVRGDLEDTLNDTHEFATEVALMKVEKPQLVYESQKDNFRELIDNIGWTEQKLESSSVRYVLDTPVNPDKPKDTVAFSPVSVATDTEGAVYVLDDGKDGGVLHVIRDNTWRELTYLAKETKVKKMPYDLCVTKDTIYVSYPDADTIAAISKKHMDPLTTITPQSLSELKPPLKAPHGVAALDKDTIAVADTGNNRLLIITKFHQVARVISGTPNAPLHSPTSVGACNGLVAVLHSGACSVHVYKVTSGELRWRTCNFDVSSRAEQEAPWEPYRISLHRTGEFKEPEVFITALYRGEQTVLRYNLQKDWLCKMGRTGKKFGQFKDLKGIEFCPSKQCVLICDYGNRRIQVYSY